MEKKPTLTSTKAEILEAYNDLLKRKETENSKNPKEERAQEQKTETVKYAAALSSEDIVKGLTGVKLQISSALDNVENTLLMQFTKLEKLQEAIRYESSYVEDLYGIKANADSLAILIAANKEKKQFFEKDLEERKRIFDELMLEKKLSWEKEQKERTQQWKEEEELRKKLIKREEDEYRYLQATNRKKEEDEYLSKKSAQEKELVEKKNAVEKNLEERENLITGKEQELATLRKQVADFPAMLEKEITAALSQQEKQLTIQHKYEKDLFAKETEGELRLLQQKISSLEGRIKEQDILIRTLNDKANTAGSQVQEIAMKALDSAAALRLQSVEKREEKEK
jgi:hypothetical protein